MVLCKQVRLDLATSTEVARLFYSDRVPGVLWAGVQPGKLEAQSEEQHVNLATLTEVVRFFVLYCTTKWKDEGM